MTATAQKVRVSDGSTIAWEEQGSGRPVLLIMGLGATRSAWEPHVASLASSFRCLMTDNRGIGDSSAPSGPYSTAQMADDHAAVIRAAGETSVAVVGISLGGAIAQQLALRHPALVSRLILVSTWATCAPYSVDCFEELKGLRPRLSPGEFARRLQLLIWSAETFEKDALSLRRERCTAETSEMGHEAFAAQCDAAISHDTLGLLGHINVPALVTVGSHDAFTPRHSSEELAAHIRNAHLEVFEGLGHAHHWESLDRFNALCERFLNE